MTLAESMPGVLLHQSARARHEAVARAAKFAAGNVIAQERAPRSFTLAALLFFLFPPPGGSSSPTGAPAGGHASGLSNYYAVPYRRRASPCIPPTCDDAHARITSTRERAIERVPGSSRAARTEITRERASDTHDYAKVGYEFNP